MPLNKSNPDLLVNFVAQIEKGPKKNREFSWITDLKVTPENVWEIMRAGRSRWKIENETFNTLKNQGYHFEHNFGLGKKHLSEIYINLMMLAFLVDQTQQIACPLFQAVLKKMKFKKYLWEKMRVFFRSYIVYSITDIFNAILYGRGRVELRDLTPG